MDVKVYEAKGRARIEIDHDICGGYGNCLVVCPAHVFEIIDGKSTAPHVERCVLSYRCVESCPTDAIKVMDLRKESDIKR